MTRTRMIVILSGLAAAPLAPAAAQTLLWTRQAGTTTYDYSNGVAVDAAGNAYITGTTSGSFGGPNEGSTDIFLAKYDASGAVVWMRQTGAPDTDDSYSVAVDSAGRAYITGTTYSNFGGPNAGAGDAFLAKYEAAGDVLWIRQIGTAPDDFSSSVAVDSAGNAYITGLTYGSLGGPNADPSGYTHDVFVVKYDAAGTLLWTRQFGTAADDFGNGVAVDNSGHLYITGSTMGNLVIPNAGADDIFLAKYDAAGTLLWMRQFGTTSFDWGNAVSVDAAGNAYIGGTTGGSLGGTNAGGADFFITKFDPSGTLIWTRQVGTSANDYGSALAADSAGNTYITGASASNLGGPSAGLDDIVLIKYDTSGSLLWTRQLGTTAAEWGYGVAVDNASNAYITGFTDGSLGGPKVGLSDIFLAKYGPSTCYPNCDASTAAPILNALDFGCFLTKFAAADPYANCDNSTVAPVLNSLDFGCFLTRFAAGCT